jgi:hypothetical protein
VAWIREEDRDSHAAVREAAVPSKETKAEENTHEEEGRDNTPAGGPNKVVPVDMVP